MHSVHNYGVTNVVFHLLVQAKTGFLAQRDYGLKIMYSYSGIMHSTPSDMFPAGITTSTTHHVTQLYCQHQHSDGSP